MGGKEFRLLKFSDPTSLSRLVREGQGFRQSTKSQARKRSKQTDSSHIGKGYPPGLFGALIPQSVQAKIIDSNNGLRHEAAVQATAHEPDQQDLQATRQWDMQQSTLPGTLPERDAMVTWF